MLPWDNWVFGLSEKREEVNKLHQQCVDKTAQVQSEVLKLNDPLWNNYKRLLANNAVLVFINQTTKFTDQQLKDYATEIEAIPDTGKRDSALTALGLVCNVVELGLAVKFMFNLGSMAKNAFMAAGDVAEVAGEGSVELIAEEAVDVGIDAAADAVALGVGEAGGESAAEGVAEAAIESATVGTLASTGIGIFIAVGLDFVFGLINGVKESKELEAIILKINLKLKDVQFYLDKIGSKTAEIQSKSFEQVTLFQRIVSNMADLLPPGHKPSFDARNVKTVEDCLEQQALAVKEFILLTALRTAYETMVLRYGDELTKQRVVNHVLDSVIPQKWITEDLLLKIWDHVIVKYSENVKNLK